MKIFHGGCHGCTQQDIHGEYFCVGCRYFQADWALPNLSNEELSPADKTRIRIKRKLALRGISTERTASKHTLKKPSFMTQVISWCKGGLTNG
jgi:hypothetical protein